MIILLLVVCTSAFISFTILAVKNYSVVRFDKWGNKYHTVEYRYFFGFAIGFCLLTLVFTICTIHLIATVATENVIDSKIEMYQEENSKIEQSIDTIVKDYMQYEQDTFTELKTDADILAFVTLYPELKSDEFVQQQIKIYVSNSKKIKSLKEEKIMVKVAKWWLYFGS